MRIQSSLILAVSLSQILIRSGAELASSRIDSWLDPVKMRALSFADNCQKKIESTGGIICDYCLHLTILITSVLNKPRKDTGHLIFMLT